MKGAVGTAASYSELLKGTKLSPSQMEDIVMNNLGLKAFNAATQVYTRNKI